MCNTKHWRGCFASRTWHIMSQVWRVHCIPFFVSGRSLFVQLSNLKMQCRQLALSEEASGVHQTATDYTSVSTQTEADPPKHLTTNSCQAPPSLSPSHTLKTNNPVYAWKNNTRNHWCINVITRHWGAPGRIKEHTFVSKEIISASDLQITQHLINWSTYRNVQCKRRIGFIYGQLERSQTGQGTHQFPGGLMRTNQQRGPERQYWKCK